MIISELLASLAGTPQLRPPSARSSLRHVLQPCMTRSPPPPRRSAACARSRSVFNPFSAWFDQGFPYAVSHALSRRQCSAFGISMLFLQGNFRKLWLV